MINSFTGIYDFLSNFYPATVTFEGITYLQSESAYQAQKLLVPESRIIFSFLPPWKAKKLGKTVQLRPDWESIKFLKMSEVVRAKFDQHPELKSRLVNTRDEPLEEGNTWGDTYWGTVNGKGKNSLGLILMSLRNSYEWDECKR